MPTYIPKADALDRKWFVIDAKGKILGKVAAAVASVLTGKRKPIYTPFLDTGDHVVVINASQVQVTGRKETDKVYYRHTGYPGGIRQQTVKEMQAKHPGRALEKPVKGMLPKGPLGYARSTRARSIPTRPRSRSP